MKNQILKLALITALIGGGFYLLSNQPQFGLTIPKIKALYEDNLQSKITATATTMTLVRGTDKQDRDLSGTYGFVIDEGSTKEEFVICTAAATALTGCTRGIDVEDGKTEVTDLKQEHRRGASVKVTNYPQLAIISRILNGDETLPNVLYYANQEIGRSSSATSTAIMDKGYMDSLALSSGSTSTYSQIGHIMLGSRTQISSTTASSTTGAPLALITANSTSTPSANIGKGYVVAVEDDGKLNQLFLDLSEAFAFTGNNTFAGTSIFSGTVTSNSTTTLAATTTAIFLRGPVSTQLTAGENLTAGDAVVAADGKVWRADADLASTTVQFLGFAKDTVITDQAVDVFTSGIVSGFSGLSTATSSSLYWLSNTTGAISNSTGTVEMLVGRAISATQLLIQRPSYPQFLSSAAAAVSVKIPQDAKLANINVNCVESNFQGQFTMFKNGDNVVLFEEDDTSDHSMTVTWNSGNSILSVANTANCASATVEPFFYY